jgi:hypothetical protein
LSVRPSVATPLKALMPRDDHERNPWGARRQRDRKEEEEEEEEEEVWFTSSWENVLAEWWIRLLLLETKKKISLQKGSSLPIANLWCRKERVGAWCDILLPASSAASFQKREKATQGWRPNERK